MSVQCLQLLPRRRAGPSGGGALASAAGRRVENSRKIGWQGTVRLVETGSGWLEDSGLILGAEAPLRVWFGVHNPGDTGMGLRVWVHIGWFQLPKKKGQESVLRLGQGTTGHSCPVHPPRPYSWRYPTRGSPILSQRTSSPGVRGQK